MSRCFWCNRKHVGNHFRWSEYISWLIKCSKCYSIAINWLNSSEVAICIKECNTCVLTHLVPIPLMEFYND